LNTRGQHLLAEYHGCNVEVLDDLKRIESLLNEAARAAQTKVVASVFRPFVPQGVSGVVVIEESHLSIHTWPEFGYASVDFYTCGSGMPEAAHRVLHKGLRAKHCELMMVDRGLNSDDKGMKMRYHRSENGVRVVEPAAAQEAGAYARSA
jgi:S-adenosylmethionine decarboxylase